MKVKTFTYYNNFIFIAIALMLLLSILLGLGSYTSMEPMLILLFGISSWSTLMLIHRRFFVKITFFTDHILYSSLFKTIVINYSDIKDLRYFNPRYISEFIPFSEIDESPFLSNFILLGDIMEYPNNKSFTLFKPVSTSEGQLYITIKYRKEMQKYLQAINSIMVENGAA